MIQIPEPPAIRQFRLAAEATRRAADAYRTVVRELSTAQAATESLAGVLPDLPQVAAMAASAKDTSESTATAAMTADLLANTLAKLYAETRTIHELND